VQVTELLRLAQSQPEIRQQRIVKVWGPKLRAEVESGRLSILSEIAAHPDQTEELRTFRYSHLLGPPLTRDQLAALQARLSGHPLPTDLSDLLLHADGIHLWADLDFGRAYWGIAPSSEWQPAAESEWAGFFEDLQRGSLAISYHQNGDYCLLLDNVTSEYRWYDHEIIDEPTVVARSVTELLDWLWAEMRDSEPRP